ncbi:recombinase family protein [Agreia sp. COWG]|uniref:recombinase family protein n=1 Tax=Agreia sp. COWG TaxID=2773266 RepID=UPI001927CEF2|nr:recombinase family protein [Agreia sp. COWG]CAD5994397.1 Resolvase/invertase-type recombinase catalytic domain-containing protein [Agreia sp. COWG]
MTGLLVGYARVSTDKQDSTSQRDALTAAGVAPGLLYVDEGLTGSTRARPALREAMAACRAGDTLMVTRLDRLARSVPDARDLVDELTRKGVRLRIGESVHDPEDPTGWLLFNALAMVAEFEADLIRARTREGMRVAKAKGKLRGKKPKLTAAVEGHLVAEYHGGDYSINELARRYDVGVATVYRAVERAAQKTPAAAVTLALPRADI